MKNIKGLISGMLLCATLPMTSHAVSGGDFFLNPYVGVEVAGRHMSWEDGNGKGHFRDNYANTNGVIGVQFHEYFAVEGGYQSTNRADQQKFYFGDNVGIVDSVLGYVDGVVFDPSVHSSQAQIRGSHLDLVGLLPVLDDTTLYASVGVAWSRFYVSTARIQATEALLAVHKWKSNHKAIFRLSAGVKQMITSKFSARAFAAWENTGKLHGTIGAIDPAINPHDFYTARVKNSYLLGLGLFYQFCDNNA